MKFLVVIFLFFVRLSIVFAAESNSQQQNPAAKIKPALEIQIWLDRKGFSPGEIDGVLGKNAEKAIAAFAEANQLQIDPRSQDALLDALREEGVEPIITYTITSEDQQGPYVDKIPADYMAMAKLKSLGYTSELEELGEKFHCSPGLLKHLNPGNNFAAGSEIHVPNVVVEKENPEPKKVQPVSGKKNNQTSQANGNSIVVSKDQVQLEVQDADGKTIFFAPITAGSDQEPYPAGSWKVVGVSRNPQFEYDPSLFHDAPAKDTKAKLAAGPNSPVGVVWITISAPHYGIHGTSEPGRIGYSESHGCIRLTNWDATKLADMVRVGMPVTFE